MAACIPRCPHHPFAIRRGRERPPRKRPWEDPRATAATCVPGFAARGSGRSRQLALRGVSHGRGSTWLPEAAPVSDVLLAGVQGAHFELGARRGSSSHRLPAWMRGSWGWSRSRPSALASHAWGWGLPAALGGLLGLLGHDGVSRVTPGGAETAPTLPMSRPCPGRGLRSCSLTAKGLRAGGRP